MSPSSSIRDPVGCSLYRTVDALRKKIDYARRGNFSRGYVTELRCQLSNLEVALVRYNRSRLEFAAMQAQPCEGHTVGIKIPDLRSDTLHLREPHDGFVLDDPE
jgi:hypothetical protein